MCSQTGVWEQGTISISRNHYNSTSTLSEHESSVREGYCHPLVALSYQFCLIIGFKIDSHKPNATGEKGSQENRFSIEALFLGSENFLMNGVLLCFYLRISIL